MEKITEINCETGEVVVRDATSKEKTLWRESQEAETQIIAIRQSALDKLQALGLTTEEITAIIS
jgi:phenylalanine-4-hydroxylase